MNTWGPDGARAAVVLTFDNLGEAQDLEFGSWPQGQPLGRHPSVLIVLPRILSMLAELQLPASFFVESINSVSYPNAMRDIVVAGHEVACHGWRHERWNVLSADEEDALLVRSTKALRELDIEPVGFRPPGGQLSSQSSRLLRRHGMRWCSPAGGHAGRLEGMAYIPFLWENVDALYLNPRLATLRQSFGMPTGSATPTDFGLAAKLAIDRVIADGGCLSLVFHPYLAEPAEAFATLRHVLERVAEARQSEGLWVAHGRTVGDWILAQEDFRPPSLETRTWMSN